MFSRLFRCFAFAFTALLLCGLLGSQSFGWVLNGYSWPAGTEIAIHLQLTLPSGPLQDGSASWNDSAADALQAWNQYIETVRFAAAAPSTAAPHDGLNTAQFASTIYGEAFGTHTLAVTSSYSPSGSTFTETDVTFNSALRWDSYRDVQQIDAEGPIYDLHRVALHEFGHVLGLDHPDQHGQTELALMNSTISALDSLMDDDIAGARALYEMPKVPLGTEFSYQIPRHVGAISFSATTLPAGLSLDASTGVISGIPTISGTNVIDLTVTYSTGNVSQRLRMTTFAPVAPFAPDMGKLLATFPLSVARLAADPQRPRVYATLPAANGVAVIDTETPRVIATVPVGAQPQGLAVSRDGSRLWVAASGSNPPKVSVIDLETLTVLPSLPVPNAPAQLAEGLDDRLYVSTGPEWAPITQIDGRTGAYQGKLMGPFGNMYGGSFLSVTPDGKTLFAGERKFFAELYKFDISSTQGTLLQFNNTPSGLGDYGLDLEVSHDGTFLCLVTKLGNDQNAEHGVKDITYKIPTSDVNASTGEFSIAPTLPGPMVFSADDRLAYQMSNRANRIAIFDTATFAQLGEIPMSAPQSPNGLTGRDVTIDNTGRELFVATDAARHGDLRVYATGKAAPKPGTPTPGKSLVNISTRLQTQPGDDALIGGFIISGQVAKHVLLRAVSTSLPVAGKLADPMLELYDSTGTPVSQNDNWNSDRAAVLATGIPPNDEHESAIMATLQPGSYTAIVRGSGNTAGVAVVEAYDLDGPTNSWIANISSRGKVGTGDDVMIGGFIVGGDQPTRTIVRAIGPSLETALNGALLDPTLELHDGDGSILAQNDNWRSDHEAEIIGSNVPPADDRESAIVATLAPGGYTAIVRGQSGTTGIGVVEVYNLEPH